jgi:membrane-associated phospholipid phosphatase
LIIHGLILATELRLFLLIQKNGFPSDHTLFASFLAFGAYRYSKKAGYALMAVAILIGWARVAAHVHHAVDVLGSLVITTIAYLMVSNLLNNEKIARKLNLNHASKRHHSDKG